MQCEILLELQFGILLKYLALTHHSYIVSLNYNNMSYRAYCADSACSRRARLFWQKSWGCQSVLYLNRNVR